MGLVAVTMILLASSLLSACGQAPEPTPGFYAIWTAAPSAQAADIATPSAMVPPNPRGATPAAEPSPAPSLTPSPAATATDPEPPEATGTATPDLTAQPSPTPVPTTAFSQDVVHLLLIGADTGSYAPDQNTDVLIVLAIDTATKQVSMLSIPRDLWVHIPSVGWSRINTAHRYGIRRKYSGGGPGLLIDTIKENLGIPVDHWIRVDYSGFVRVVDQLGGLNMLVPCQVNLRYKPPTSDSEEEMILSPGLYHFDGTTALRYVRTRRGESDFDRAHRQQQFLKALWDQFRSTDIVARIPGLWSAMQDSLSTDLTLGDVLALAPIAADLQRNQLHSYYIGRNETQNWITPEGWEVLLPIPDKVQQVIARLYQPPSPAEEALVSEAAHVQVLNGAQSAYLGEIAADQLRWYGLDVVETRAADRADYQRTQIVVLGDKPVALETLTQLLKVKPEDVILAADPSAQVDLQVILGADYDPCR